jgi:hypothetical protein
MKEQLLEIIKAVRDEFGYQYIPDARVALEQVEQKLLDLSPWFSVDDRLPEEGSRVLALYAWSLQRKPVLDYEICFFDDDCFWLYDHEGDKIKINVTHWMPLPEPQKAK